MKKTFLLLAIIAIAASFSYSGNSQQDPFAVAETTLKSLFTRMASANDETVKSLNDSAILILNQTLQMQGSFEYPFNDLKNLGKITSPDKKVRIFTWNISLKDGSNEFFGFLIQKDNNNQKVYKLTDQNAEITNPEAQILSADHWLGCLIYDIIEEKAEGITLYTLLGFRPENMFVSKKIADVLWFNNNVPSFGKPVFVVKTQTKSRIIFTYSARVRMSLQWNSQLKMIVFDHLSPSSPAYTGNYQYYGPDLSFDGLRFEKNIWQLVENVNPRNMP